MSEAMMLATGILLGLAVALVIAAAITPILKERARWSLLLLGGLLFLAICLVICALILQA